MRIVVCMLKIAKRVETDLLSLVFSISYMVFKNKILINETPGGWSPHMTFTSGTG